MPFLVLLLAALLLAIIILPFVAFFKSARAERLANQFSGRLRDLEEEIRRVRRDEHPAAPATPEPVETKAASPESSFQPPATAPAARPTPPPAVHIPLPSAQVTAPRQVPPPLAQVPPPPPPRPPSPQPLPDIPRPAAIDWEQFMGAKFFAWVGGFALFLGIAFFVKYSFEHDLIPPAVRVAIGFIAGIVLLAGGVLMKRKENAVTAQTLCATGVLVLYAVTYACRSYYHFKFFGEIETFMLMSLITAVAFLLAIRMNAIGIAVLGIAGGFLTPVLLSTGQDNPLGLFGYIALLDIGLLAIARKRFWKVLPALGALGTILTQIAWIAAFFEKGHYSSGNKIFIAMTVFAGFEALFIAAAWRAKKASSESDSPAAGAALAVGCFAFFCAFYFLTFASLGHRPILLCGYLFLVDLGLVGLTLIAKRFDALRTVAGVAAFAFLGIWTQSYLTNANLIAALGCYFAFAVFHTALPLVLQRFRPVAMPAWTHVFPALSLLLVMMPIFRFHDLTILVWPFVLLVDILAFIVAVITMALAPVIIVLLLTLVAIAGMLLSVPADLTGLPTDLFLLGACSLFFLAVGSWAARRLVRTDAKDIKDQRPRLFGSIQAPANLAVQIPALSAVLPFLLLIMVMLRLPLHDPGPVFGLALLLLVLLLGLATILSLDALPLVGLVSALSLEHTWLASPYHATRPLNSLVWYLVFYGVFTLFPFLFRRRFAEKKTPWTASALAGPFHFYLVYEMVKLAWPKMQPGFPPALFAVPALLGLALLVRKHPAANPARNTQLALYGGVALFFITLVFPLQFDREWITISWALEGAALCWLFHRVPHPGLRLVGVGLLVVSFARLALNPFVLSYHSRSAHPIFNWYLYAFGIVSLALFAAARLLARPRNLVTGKSVLPLLYSLGSALLFLLVNVEIADYFCAIGAPVLVFEFSGNFARDMSYSIAWALFALLLLVIGIFKRNKPVRYSSLALLGVTVIKLFFHDLSELDQLYRIAAFIVVAVIAIFASFLYQRFLGKSMKAEV